MLFVPTERNEPGPPVAGCCLDEPRGHSAKKRKSGTEREILNVLIHVESKNIDLVKRRGWDKSCQSPGRAGESREGKINKHWVVVG